VGQRTRSKKQTSSNKAAVSRLLDFRKKTAIVSRVRQTEMSERDRSPTQMLHAPQRFAGAKPLVPAPQVRNDEDKKHFCRLCRHVRTVV
jgi:hypothetical protein